MLAERTTYQGQIRSEFESRLTRLDEQEKELEGLKDLIEQGKKKIEKSKAKLAEEKEAREADRERAKKNLKAEKEDREVERDRMKMKLQEERDAMDKERAEHKMALAAKGRKIKALRWALDLCNNYVNTILTARSSIV